MHERREQARELRRQGMSVKEIARTMGAGVGSVSVWVRDIILTDEQVEILKNRQRKIKGQNKGAQTNRTIFKALRQQYQEEGRIRAREQRPLHLTGCLLYWAEGAKGRNSTYFVNSDPAMMLLFMRFLREEMLIQSEDMAIYIHCHTTDKDEMNRIEQYWLELLELPQSALRKTMVKKGSTTRYNILHNGVCGLRVKNSTWLTMHIYGAIQEYGNFDRPEWLF
jgi:predicted transcriptional regulator